MQRRKNEPIPVGWAQGPDGHPTTDASVAFDTACLMPLGGTELTSGYKGYGLGAMVEVFCGVLAGANYATKIRKWTHAGADSEADLGQCFVAINPACFAPGFEGRLSDLTGILRNMPMVCESCILFALFFVTHVRVSTYRLIPIIPSWWQEIRNCTTWQWWTRKVVLRTT